MTMSTLTTTLPATFDQTLERVCGEFLEMPGLRITCRQAQRLWGLDECTCRQLLESLVESRFLCHRGEDAYGRLTEGRVSIPRRV